MRSWIAAAAVALSMPLVACATYQDDLARSQKAFEQNQHERALAILRALEPDATRLSPPERAQYAYLRGMTDYRIGYRSDARHWLAVAHSIEQSTPNALPTDWSKRLGETLGELNEAVYTGGTRALDRKQDVQQAPAASSSATKKKDGDFDQ